MIKVKRFISIVLIFVLIVAQFPIASAAESIDISEFSIGESFGADETNDDSCDSLYENGADGEDTFWTEKDLRSELDEVKDVEPQGEPLHYSTGTSLIPSPEILYGTMAEDNSYIDIYFNMGVYAAGLEPLTLSSFRSKFYNNGGEFFTVIPTALTKIDGTEVLGGEDALRLYFDMDGEPTSKETIEIKPSGGLSIFNLNGDAMESGQSTGQIKLRATIQSIISMEMAVDNSYVDVAFNMGVYGDSNR